jgi:hypothetical protein
MHEDECETRQAMMFASLIPPQLPPRIEAAMEFMRLSAHTECSTADDSVFAEETAALRRAVITLLIHYFTGEMES